MAIGCISGVGLAAGGVGLGAVATAASWIAAVPVALRLLVGRGSPSSEDARCASLNRRSTEADDGLTAFMMQTKSAASLIDHHGLLGITLELPMAGLAKRVQPCSPCLAVLLQGVAIGLRLVLQLVRLPLIGIDLALAIGLSSVAAALQVAINVVLVGVDAAAQQVCRQDLWFGRASELHGMQWSHWFLPAKSTVAGVNLSARRSHEDLTRLAEQTDLLLNKQKATANTAEMDLAQRDGCTQQEKFFAEFVKQSYDEAEAVQKARARDDKPRVTKVRVGSQAMNRLVAGLAATSDLARLAEQVTAYCASTKLTSLPPSSAGFAVNLGPLPPRDNSWVERLDDVCDYSWCVQRGAYVQQKELDYVKALNHLIGLFLNVDEQPQPADQATSHGARERLIQRARVLKQRAVARQAGSLEAHQQVEVLTQLIEHCHHHLLRQAHHRITFADLEAVRNMFFGDEKVLLKDVLLGQRHLPVMDDAQDLWMPLPHPPVSLTSIILAAWHSGSAPRPKGAPGLATVATQWGSRIPAHQAQLLRAWSSLSADYRAGHPLFAMRAVEATLGALAMPLEPQL